MKKENKTSNRFPQIPKYDKEIKEKQHQKKNKKTTTTTFSLNILFFTEMILILTEFTYILVQDE